MGIHTDWVIAWQAIISLKILIDTFLDPARRWACTSKLQSLWDNNNYHPVITDFKTLK